MNKLFSTCIIGGFVMLMGCAKDEIDITELITNPFDADYTGAPVFTYLNDTTTVELINGQPARVLTIEVQVHTEYFGRITTYLVSVDGGALIPSNSIPNGVITLRRTGVNTGEEYCTALRLSNDGAFGAGNSVCATAD